MIGLHDHSSRTQRGSTAMMPNRSRPLVAACALVLLWGCAAPPEEAPVRVLPIEDPAPVRKPVADLGRFSEFIATRPTPGELRERYPDLMVVMPGQIATKEFRTDNSRYFVALDEQGRVIGGRFQ